MQTKLPSPFELKVLAYSLLAVLLLVGILSGMLLYPSILQFSRWRERTSPLEEEVIADICQSFSISEDDPLCKPGATTYGPDFFPAIQKVFHPSEDEWATFDEVEQKIGDYKTHCEPQITQADGTEYFACFYDLRGDGAFPIFAMFDSNGQMFRLINNLENQ